MVAIIGKYQDYKHEQMDEFIRQTPMEVSEEFKVFIINSKPLVEVSKDGDNWQLAFTFDGKTNVQKFKLGEPFEETFEGKTFSNTVTQPKDDELVIKAQSKGIDYTGQRRFVFSDEGLVIFHSNNKVSLTAKQYFKRL